MQLNNTKQNKQQNTYTKRTDTHIQDKSKKQQKETKYKKQHNTHINKNKKTR